MLAIVDSWRDTGAWQFPSDREDKRKQERETKASGKVSAPQHFRAGYNNLM